MAEAVIFTDLHLGLKRSSSFTKESLARRNTFVFEKAMGLAQQFTYALDLGDLFDNASNPEAVIEQGQELVMCSTLTLAGNHDMINREGAVSSLQLINNVAPTQVCLSEVRALTMVGDNGKRSMFYFAPHTMTNEQYLESLVQLEDMANQDEVDAKVLCLHCNYDNHFAESEHSLNLTRDRAAELLEPFDFILMGHEHGAREDFGGRLKVVGSLYPTGFFDFASKHRALHYDLETLQFTDLVTETTHYEGPASEALDVDPNGGYFKLTGEVTPETFKTVVALYDRGAFAVQVAGQQTIKKDAITFEPVAPMRSRIGEALGKDAEHLLPLWKEFVESEEQEAC